jgi:hypothetical protein
MGICLRVVLMKLRSKLYQLDIDGSWKDLGAGWSEVINDSIVMEFEGSRDRSKVRKYSSRISVNHQDFQQEGGMLPSFHFYSLLY